MMETSLGKQDFDRDQARMSLIVVRQDLTLPQQLVQACHASSMAGHHFPGWAQDTRMALLAAKDLNHLLEAVRRLRSLDIPFCDFFEPDHAIGFSALATAPLPWKQARKALPKYELWTPQKEREMVALD
jgi:hypothetical protein